MKHKEAKEKKEAEEAQVKAVWQVKDVRDAVEKVHKELECVVSKSPQKVWMRLGVSTNSCFSLR